MSFWSILLPEFLIYFVYLSIKQFIISCFASYLFPIFFKLFRSRFLPIFEEGAKFQVDLSMPHIATLPQLPHISTIATIATHCHNCHTCTTATNAKNATIATHCHNCHSPTATPHPLVHVGSHCAREKCGPEIERDRRKPEKILKMPDLEASKKHNKPRRCLILKLWPKLWTWTLTFSIIINIKTKIDSMFETLFDSRFLSHHITKMPKQRHWGLSVSIGIASCVNIWSNLINDLINICRCKLWILQTYMSIRV